VRVGMRLVGHESHVREPTYLFSIFIDAAVLILLKEVRVDGRRCVEGRRSDTADSPRETNTVFAASIPKGLCEWVFKSKSQSKASTRLTLDESSSRDL
jgi:hypothetical protein